MSPGAGIAELRQAQATARDVRPGSTERPAWKPWLLAAALASPALVPIAAHYIGLWIHGGYRPTGFIEYDAPYYMANARHVFDGTRFTGTYSNPSSFHYDSPRIYFQPLTLVLGLILHATHADPGLVLTLAGVVGAVVATRAALAIYDAEVPRQSGVAGAAVRVGFFWGGGCLVLAALLEMAVRHAWGGDVLAYDPADGWWMLSLGRTFVIPTEAWYHAIFLASLVAIIRGHYKTAFGLLALMSVSHPFTGIELLAIAIAWAAVERGLRRPTPPMWFLGACVALAGLHLGYYRIFLERFPEHAQLMRQWTLNWTLPNRSLVLAYGLVAALACWTLRTPARVRAYMATPEHRLLAVWFVVALALAKHDLFMRPVQPLHFTRGYVWAPLYLMGAPSLHAAFRQMAAWRLRRISLIGAVSVMMLLVSDNIGWFGSALDAELLGAGPQARFGGAAGRLGIAVPSDEDALFRWFNDPANRGGIVISADPMIGYLATVYSPLRAWSGHYFNTPWAGQRRSEAAAFFRTGRVVPIWRSLPLIVVWSQGETLLPALDSLRIDSTRPAFASGSYRAFRAGAWP